MGAHAMPAGSAAADSAGPSLILQPGRLHTHNELSAMRLDGLVEHIYGPAYIPAGEPATPGHRALAARSVLPERIRGKVVIGRMSAAWIYGCAPPPTTVSALLDHRYRTTSQGRCRAASIHEVLLGPLDTTTVAGVPVTTALRTALDVALHAPEEEAVPALLALAADAALGCPPDYIRQALLARIRLPGRRQALARIERVLARLAGR